MSTRPAEALDVSSLTVHDLLRGPGPFDTHEDTVRGVLMGVGPSRRVDGFRLPSAEAGDTQGSRRAGSRALRPRR